MLRTILSVTFLFTGLLRLAAATEYFTDIRKEAALVQRGSDEDYLLGINSWTKSASCPPHGNRLCHVRF